MTPEQRQHVADEMHRRALLHGYHTYRVELILPDGQRDAQVVEAADEWKARTMSIMLTSLHANGQEIDFIVTKLD